MINTRTCRLVGFETFQGVATVLVPVEVLAWRTPPTPFILYNICRIYREITDSPLDLFVDLTVGTFPTPPGSPLISLGLDFNTLG